MRWDLLFADLEALADATERAGLDADVADRGRSERAALLLVDRLRAHAGSTIAVRLITGDRLTARVADVGADWVLLEDARDVLVVSLAGVMGIEGLSRRAEPEVGGLARRVRLGVVLRRLARERAGVEIRLADGAALTGTIDRVAADHFDLALHPAGEPRRAGGVRGVCVVPLAAVVVVRAGA